eukprot:gene19949-biopygen17680
MALITSPDPKVRLEAQKQFQELYASNPLNMVTTLIFGIGGYLLIRYILEKKPNKKQPEIHWMDKLGENSNEAKLVPIPDYYYINTEFYDKEHPESTHLDERCKCYVADQAGVPQVLEGDDWQDVDDVAGTKGTTNAPSPLAAYSSEWNADKYKACNTAANARYMSDEERTTIYILNLARTNPKLFCETVVKPYCKKAGIDMGSEHYFKSLVKRYNGECCSYGVSGPVGVIVDLLVDEGVENLGHREILLT